jgi:hypothetical protein
MIGVVRTVTPSLVVTLNAYSANDVVGGLITIPANSASGGGVIRQVLITDAANQKEPYTLYLFDAEPTTIANDAAFAPTIADLKKIAATMAIAALDYVEVNSLAYAIKSPDLEFSVLGGSLYAYLVAGDTPDYAAVTDLTLKFTLEFPA